MVDIYYLWKNLLVKIIFDIVDSININLEEYNLNIFIKRMGQIVLVL